MYRLRHALLRLYTSGVLKCFDAVLARQWGVVPLRNTWCDLSKTMATPLFKQF